MNQQPEDTLHVQGRPIQCPQCRYYCHPKDTHCPNCYAELKSTAKLDTQDLTYATRYALAPSHQQIAKTLAQNAHLILQILPSAICIPLSLHTPVILGRCKDEADRVTIIDLSAFHAHELGVSRHHCQLQRHDDRVIVVDLNSSNQSYLNNTPMMPQHDYVLTHKDQLILGRMYINVLFSFPIES